MQLKFPGDMEIVFDQRRSWRRFWLLRTIYVSVTHTPTGIRRGEAVLKPGRWADAQDVAVVLIGRVHAAVKDREALQRERRAAS